MKRKLKDLKENECIKVNTLAQAKYFIEKFRWEKVNPTEIVGRHILVDTTEGRRYFWCESLKPKNEYPASDFIKPKKSGMKQAIKELRNTCKELAETQKKTNEYLEVLNGKNEPIGNSEQLGDSSKMEHTELEAGKWYKNKYTEDLCFRERDEGNYGIFSNEWNTYIICATPTEWTEATAEEVESALIKEAERRGFNTGVKICRNLINKSSNRPPLPTQVIDIRMFENDPVWHYESEENFLEHYGLVVFDSGIWAEIISEEQTIDWSKPGQLMYDTDGFVVINSGLHTGFQFEAMILKGQMCVGEYKTLLNKSEFKPYNGTITLKND